MIKLQCFSGKLGNLPAEWVWLQNKFFVDRNPPPPPPRSRISSSISSFGEHGNPWVLVGGYLIVIGISSKSVRREVLTKSAMAELADFHVRSSSRIVYSLYVDSLKITERILIALLSELLPQGDFPYLSSFKNGCWNRRQRSTRCVQNQTAKYEYLSWYLLLSNDLQTKINCEAKIFNMIFYQLPSQT